MRVVLLQMRAVLLLAQTLAKAVEQGGADLGRRLSLGSFARALSWSRWCRDGSLSATHSNVG